MNTFKSILIAIVVIAILAIIFFVVVGYKVVSSVLGLVLGGIGGLILIGVIIYLIGKARGGKSQE